MTDPTNPKIVDGTIPEFGQSTTKPDTLETTVTPQTANPTSSNQKPLTDWEQENMVLLGQELTKLMHNSCGSDYTKQGNGNIISPKIINLGPIDSLLPHTITTKKDTPQQNSYVIHLNVQLPSTHLICSFLEKIYGSEIAQSGLYEATGLDKGTTSFDLLNPYFSEIKELTKIENTYLPLFSNPYQTLLLYPFAVRPFFTGAIKEANMSVTDNKRSTFFHPLSLQQILAYAKKVNQVPKVAEYMKIMNELKEGA